MRISDWSSDVCSSDLNRPGQKPLDSKLLSSDISVMTEIKETHPKLSPAATEFILHWGNLGGQWGVNRSVAQIHALLFISDRPLQDRKRVVSGKGVSVRVDLGGRRFLKTNKKRI